MMSGPPACYNACNAKSRFYMRQSQHERAIMGVFYDHILSDFCPGLYPDQTEGAHDFRSQPPSPSQAKRKEGTRCRVKTKTLSGYPRSTADTRSRSRGPRPIPGLTIADGANVLHREPVGLSFDALFGPDVADLASWQKIAIRKVLNQMVALSLIEGRSDPANAMGTRWFATPYGIQAGLRLVAVRRAQPA